jgi:hypothetical protein
MKTAVGERGATELRRPTREDRDHEAEFSDLRPDVSGFSGLVVYWCERLRYLSEVGEPGTCRIHLPLC